MILFLVRLKHVHEERPKDLRELDNEALLAFMQAEFHISEYRMFELECKRRYGRVIEVYVDNMYELWMRKRKMPDALRVFMLDVLEGRYAFEHTLVV